MTVSSPDRMAADPWPEEHFVGPPTVYPSGVTLFRQGDLPTTLYLIVEGVVKLTIQTSDDREVIVGLRMANWIVGIGSAILNSAYHTTATTISPCTLRSIRRTDLSLLSDTDLGVNQWLLRMQAREWSDQVTLMGFLGATDPRHSVERLLVRIARAGHAVMPDGSIRLTLPLRRYEMAQMVRVTSEHFSRLLSEWVHDGLIRRDKGWLVIPRGSRLIAAIASLEDS